MGLCFRLCWKFIEEGEHEPSSIFCLALGQQVLQAVGEGGDSLALPHPDALDLLVPVEAAHLEHVEERLLHLLVGALKVVAAGVDLLLGGEGLVEMPSLAVLRDVFPVVISDPRLEITYKNISASLLLWGRAVCASNGGWIWTCSAPPA